MDKAAKNSRNVTVFLCVLCVISNLSYYPAIIKSGWGRRVAIAVWIILGLYILFRVKIKFASSTAFQVYTIMFILFLINTAIVTLSTGGNAFRNHFFQPVMIATAIFVCAGILQKDVSPGGLRKICRAYYDCIAIISVPLFIIYLRGLDLASREYKFKYGKNEIAVLLLAALIISFTVYKPKGVPQQLFRIFATIFIVADIVYLRCRSVLLCCAIMLAILILNSSRLSTSARVILILGILGAILFFLLRQDMFDKFLNNIIYAGRNANDMDDVSSGRETQIREGLNIFSENPLFGTGRLGKSLDNFYVSVLANYGIFGLPLLVMSVLPMIWGLVKVRQKTDLHLLFVILAVSLSVIAYLEELAPFGPGTRCYLLWLMWGLMVGRDIRAEDEAAKVQAAEEEAKDGKTPGKVPVPTA